MPLSNEGVELFVQRNLVKLGPLVLGPDRLLLGADRSLDHGGEHVDAGCDFGLGVAAKVCEVCRPFAVAENLSRQEHGGSGLLRWGEVAQLVRAERKLTHVSAHPDGDWVGAARLCCTLEEVRLERRAEVVVQCFQHFAFAFDNLLPRVCVVGNPDEISNLASKQVVTASTYHARQHQRRKQKGKSSK